MRYKVNVPIGKEEPGPGYKVGEVINDGDLPAETIEKFIGWGFLSPIPDKKAAVKKATKQDEVKDNA